VKTNIIKAADAACIMHDQTVCCSSLGQQVPEKICGQMSTQKNPQRLQNGNKGHDPVKAVFGSTGGGVRLPSLVGLLGKFLRFFSQLYRKRYDP